MDPGSIIVIIPALNEEGAIPAVLEKLKALGLSRIRVVDNGSTDRTAIVAEEYGAEVIREPIRGYGQACWRGLQDLSEDIDWVLFCDADGCDDLSSLEGMMLNAEQSDFILGDRRASEQGRNVLTPVQNFGNWLATSLIRLGWGQAYNDLGPMRLIRRTALERIAMRDRGFGWTVEMQVRAVEEGLRIRELPVPYHRRQAGESKISGTVRGSFHAGRIILTTLLRLYLAKKDRAPVLLLGFSSLLLFVGALLMLPNGDFRTPGAVEGFLVGAAFMGIGFVSAWRLPNLGIHWFWIVAIFLRLLLLLMYPGDDIWRYIWEGLVQNSGFNPYVLAPSSLDLLDLRTEWWHLIQHKDISAIYPPLCQLGFRILAACSTSVVVFKLAFLLVDLVVCWLLCRRFGPLQSMLYGWNPLVIYSFAGGGHYDAWFLLMITCGWLLWESSWWGPAWFKKEWLVALAFGSGVALKYVCAPLLAWVCWHVYCHKGWRSAFGCLIFGVLPFFIAWSLLPGSAGGGHLVPGDFARYARSADLIPYLLGGVWEASKRMNWIFMLPLALGIVWRIIRQRDLGSFALEFWLMLMLLSPAVHAWYWTWAMPFMIKARHDAWKWGALSAFVYFLLQKRTVQGQDWQLSPLELLLMWGPLVAGACWYYWKNWPVSSKEHASVGLS